MKEDLKRYLQILQRLQSGGGDRISNEDFRFFAEFTPDPNDKKRLSELNDQIVKLSKEDKTIPPNLTAETALLAGQQALQNPSYREQALQLAQESEAKANSDKIAQGLNVLLGATDIAQSVAQINQSKQGLSKSRRPGRPAIPQRDLYLQQALRAASEGTYDTASALAPAEAQIQDQYLSDLQNAKTASTGQAGAFGSYAQVAANRRRRAGMELIPLANDIRREQTANYNNLLGQRLNETQNIFENQASFYPQDLNQYQNEQAAYGQIGSVGRQNLNNSLYNLAGRIAPVAGQYQARNKYKRFFDQLDNVHPGISGKIEPAINYLDNKLSPQEEEMYTGY